jgi:hypothetical protein
MGPLLKLFLILPGNPSRRWYMNPTFSFRHRFSYIRITKLKINYMKKLLYTATFAVLALSISSCGTSSGSSTTKEFIIPTTGWAASGTPGTSDYLYYYSHTETAITQSVVDYGYVLCYLKFTGTNTQYAPLPYTFTNSGTPNYEEIYNFQYQANPGTIFFTRKDSDLNTVPPSFSLTVKIVIVSTKDKPLLDGVNTNDYLEVKHALKLAE